MGRYINWEDAVLRYSGLDNLGGSVEVGSAWIGAIEAQLDGLLSPQYSVPFSSNNETVKDLAIELLYIRSGNLKVEEADDMRTSFMDRIKRLKEGEEGMITEGGVVVGMVGDTFWSSTGDYHPVFDLGSTLDFVVDSAQVNASENAKL